MFNAAGRNNNSFIKCIKFFCNLLHLWTLCLEYVLSDFSFWHFLSFYLWNKVLETANFTHTHPLSTPLKHPLILPYFSISTGLETIFVALKVGALNLTKILKTACGFILMLRFLKPHSFFSEQPLKSL